MSLISKKQFDSMKHSLMRKSEWLDLHCQNRINKYLTKEFNKQLRFHVKTSGVNGRFFIFSIDESTRLDNLYTFLMGVSLYMCSSTVGLFMDEYVKPSGWKYARIDDYSYRVYLRENNETNVSENS